MESRCLKESYPDYPPIFIVGLPRSGSTLLYQLLVVQYGLGYFSNLSNFFYKSPVTIATILHQLRLHYKSKNLQSHFGLINGLISPSESGSIFRYWFDQRPNDHDAREHIRKSVQNISRLYNNPFITKNLYNIFRINILSCIFPKAYYIIIKRDPKYVAQSLLLARKASSGTYNDWFGLKPIDYQKISQIKDPFLQVFHQVESINKSIDGVISNVKQQYIEVDYKSLCNNTQNELARIADKYRQYYDICLYSRYLDIANIHSQDRTKMNETDWERLTTLFNQ
jgi:hypothetical protein